MNRQHYQWLVVLLVFVGLIFGARAIDAAISRSYTVDYSATGDTIGRDSLSDGAVRKLDQDLTDGYTHLNNLQKNYSSATAPSSPQEGMTWWDSTNDMAMWYTGTAWQPTISWYKTIEVLELDGNATPTTGLLQFNNQPVVQFNQTYDTMGYFSFKVPTSKQGYNADNFLTFHMDYCMDVAYAGKVLMNIEYWVNGNSSQTGYILQDEITTPTDTAWTTHDGTGLKITDMDIAGGDVVTCKLMRNVTGTASNHTGNFQLINLWVTND